MDFEKVLDKGVLDLIILDFLLFGFDGFLVLVIV